MESGLTYAYQLAAGNGSTLADELSPFLNYGVLGLFVIGLLLGRVWVKPSVDKVISEKDAALERILVEKQELVKELQAERDRLIADRAAMETRLIAEKAKAEEQRDQALSIAQDKIIPLLTTVGGTLETFIPLLQGIVSGRKDGDDRR